LSVTEFVYLGEVSVAQTDLPSFLNTAGILRIKGLAEDEGRIKELVEDKGRITVLAVIEAIVVDKRTSGG